MSLYQLEQTLLSKTITYDCNNNKEIKNYNHLEFDISKAYNKSKKRVLNIINHINNKKNNNIVNINNINIDNINIRKKYQIRGYHEYKILHNYLNEKNIKHKLIIDSNILTNKVKQIKQYVSDYDYENNLQHVQFMHEKVPTLYIAIF